MRSFSLCLLFLVACESARPRLSNKVVLDVNGRKFTAEVFAQELAQRLKDQDSLSAKDPRLLKAIKNKIVEDFIVQSITEDWCKKQNLVVKAEDLEAQIKAVRQSYPDDLSFQQALTEEGISFKDWKAKLQTTLLQKLLVQKLGQSSETASEAELQTYYQAHKAEFTVRESAQIRHILVATESDAKALEDELKKGKRMADLAKKYSISPEAAQGGMVGWIEKGSTDVFDPAFRMKVGARSPVVKSSFGYHIFELVARKPSKAKLFPEVRKDLQRILMEKREQSAYVSWLEDQVRQARVFKDQEFLDAMKVETKVQ
jgi:peptidyl-prolyl cis-trans isomerase C